MGGQLESDIKTELDLCKSTKYFFKSYHLMRTWQVPQTHGSRRFSLSLREIFPTSESFHSPQSSPATWILRDEPNAWSTAAKRGRFGSPTPHESPLSVFTKPSVYFNHVYTASVILNILIMKSPTSNTNHRTNTRTKANASPSCPTSSSLCLSLLSLLLDVSLMVDMQRWCHSAANQLN